MRGISRSRSLASEVVTRRSRTLMDETAELSRACRVGRLASLLAVPSHDVGDDAEGDFTRVL